jgi:hypothetical protein
MSVTESGQLSYTERAFEQDADQAMGSDIVKALIELITNSDDAYGGADGEIAVEIIRVGDEPTKIVVRDEAKGLTEQGLKNCFSVLGGTTGAVHSGQRSRGLLGRGAKDTAAFGRTVFESICNGAYASFELLRSGHWTLSTSRPATAHDHSTLRISPGRSGMQVTVVVEKRGVVIPRHDALVERLQSHVQLRELTRRRTVSVASRTNGRPAASTIARWEAPASEPILDLEFDVPGYPATARLELRKLALASNDGLSVYSRQGIVVQSSSTAFTNTMFGATGPECCWISGTLHCDYIDTLIIDYDNERGNDANPTRLLRRDRDGLAEGHPFYRSLTSAVLDRLAPVLDSLRPDTTGSGGGEQIKRDLSAAGQTIGALLRADLQRIEADEPAGVLRPNRTSPVIVIPPRLKMLAGSTRSLTVLLDRVALGAELEVEASVSNHSVIRLVSQTDPVDHANFADTAVLNVRLSALELGPCTVTITHAATGASASCEVVVHDEPTAEPEPPVTLEWADPSMSVTLGKSRSVRLRAPVELAPDGQLDCEIRSDGNSVVIESTIVTLRLTGDGWLEGRCAVRGVSLGEPVEVEAVGGATSAVGSIRVTQPTALSGSNLRMELLNNAQGNARGALRTDEDGYLIEIYGQHSALRPMLGDITEDGSFSNEGEAPARHAISEAIASTVSDWLIRRAATSQPHLFPDYEAVLAERAKYVSRYLVPLLTKLSREFAA